MLITESEQEEYFAYKTPDDVLENLRSGLKSLEQI